MRRIIPVGVFLAAGILLIFSVGLAQRFGWISRHDAASPNAATVTGTIYTCPMHPQIRQPTPGRCPICGMELVPASSGAANIEELAVKIEPAQRRLANIQTAPVESGPIDAVLQSVGMIAIDESRQATIAAYIDGRMERLFADYTGVDIKKGDHLAVIYSPQLYAAQVEYVEARRALSSTGGLAGVRQAQEALAANTRQRLREFGMTDQQLSELETSGQAQSRLTIYAPQGGTVVEKLVVEGSYVKAGDPIYRIAELTTVWLMLRLFPEDAGRIRFGQRVEATVQSSPAETLEGRVAFIDPTVDPKTRTVGVRVELMNEQRRLRPGDYAEARITLPIGPQGEVYDADLAGKWISPMHPQIVRAAPGQCPICGMDLVPTSRYGFANQPVPQPASLSVPRSAVLLAGGNSVVYAETQPGRFEIRPVKVGPILREKIVILEGLKAGESVATAGNFLIDSQMQLAGKPSLIDPTRAVAATQKESEGPLQVKHVAVAPVTGEAGKKLEVLYAAYFDVQKALAADKTPPEQAAQRLYQTATELAQDNGLSAESRKLVGEVAAKSEHLHHLDLKGARKEFKPISHAVVALAAQARAADAAAAYVHFYCPMVPGGGGDWLQQNNELVNPYWGAEMLRCGEKVQTFAPPKPSSPDGHGAHGAHGGHQHGAGEQRQIAPQKTEAR
ncbi:MAG: efflux RND transporter periplasmic adaptor subunit [Planctomycetaceae bacterium]|nr:efflux RND transporter periplasmic adaptor subunit [Planctomycetaceae bacterium]